MEFFSTSTKASIENLIEEIKWVATVKYEFEYEIKQC